MADTVDSLQIEIEANSADAAAQVNKLAAALERLKKSSGGEGLSQTAKRVRAVRGAASGSSGTGARKPTAEHVDSAEIDRATEKVRGLRAALESVGEGITRYLNNPLIAGTSLWAVFGEKSISALSKIQQAAQSVGEKLRTAIQPAINIIQTNFAKGIDFARSKLDQFGNFASSAFQKIAQNDKVQFAFRTIAQPIALIAGVVKTVLDPAISLASAGIKKFAGVAGPVFSGAMNLAAKGAKKLGSALLDLGKKGVSAAIGGLKKLGGYIGSRFTAPFKNAVKAVTTWKNALGRIAFYRIVRGAIKAITDSFKEGIDNLYQYSLIVSTKFAPAMDSLATSALYLKNSLGAMVAPIIQQLAPAVDYLVDRFVDLTNAIGKAMAALTGQSVFSQAKKYATEYAEAAGDAAKATKSFTIGLDELNIIEESTGRGGKDDLDYSSMFEEVEVPTETMNWANLIRESIENGDWYGVGAALAVKLNSVVSGLDLGSWGKSLGVKISDGLLAVYAFMKNFNFYGLGATIADGLNGLFDGINFEMLGMVFASKWNALISLVSGFVSSFNWADLGVNISDAINGWFREINWDGSGKTLSDGVLGVFDTLRTAITNIQWEQIGADIAYFLNAIDWVGVLSGLGVTISEGLNAAVNLVAGLTGTLDWGEIGGATATALTDTLNAISFSDIGKAISNVLSGALDFVIEFLDKFDFIEFTDTLFKGIGEAVENIDILGIAKKLATVLVQSVLSVPSLVLAAGGGVFNVIGSLFESIGLNGVAGFFKGIGDALTGAATWLKEHLVDPVVNAVKNLFGIHSPSTVFAEIGDWLIQGLYNGISGAWSGIKEFFSNALLGIATTIGTAWDKIVEGTVLVFTGIKQNVVNIFEGLKNAIKTPINAILGFVEGMANGVISGLNNAIGAINNLRVDIPDWVPGVGGKYLGFNIPKLGQVNIPRLAGGGVVDAGQLFIANEAGPELVGNIGSKTGVANAEQIVEGIREGVRDANEEQNALLREQNELLRAILAKDNSVRIGDRDIKRAYDRSSRNAGASIMPGGVLA